MSHIFEILREAQRERALLDRAIASTATNSRNFEVLRLAQKDARLFEAAEPRAALPIEPAPPRIAEFSRDETFRLVQRVFLSAGAAAPRAVVFCSIDEGSRRNWICARVAELLSSHTRRSVCIVDANLGCPGLHDYFKVRNRRGLAEAISEPGTAKDFTQALGTGCLSLMSAGVLPPGVDCNAVLASGRLRARISEIRASFDYVVVDAPPAAASSVTGNLAGLADGVILIVEPSFTPRQAACDAKLDIEAAGGRVLGVVFDRRGLALPVGTGQPEKSSKPAPNS
jgi:Mrp family chromosome partitioning ATPase